MKRCTRKAHVGPNPLPEDQFFKNSKRCKACDVIVTSKYHKENPETSLRYRAKTKYNLSLEQIAEMTQKQDEKCAICKTVVKLVIDHCHETNIVRGLLCDHCNRGLGMFRDNPEILKSAINYLL